MYIEDLEDSFRNILLPEVPELTNMIVESQNGPQPDLPYATFRILSLNHVGRVQREFLNPDGSRQFYQHLSIPIRLTTYGPYSTSLMTKFSMALNKKNITDQMADANIAFSTRSDIRKLPELVNASWQERAEMIVTVHSMMTDQEFMDLIETVQGAGIFSSASGTTISEDFKASLGV
jgi:hypothetical protein